MTPAVGSLRVKGKLLFHLDLLFSPSWDHFQLSSQIRQEPPPAPLLFGEVWGENQLSHQPHLGRIKQVDLWLVKASVCFGLERMY